MGVDSNITLPAELFAQVQALAAKEGKTADELTVEAVKRDIAGRLIANLKREVRPSGMTEAGNPGRCSGCSRISRAVMSVVLDSNIWLSAFIFRGKPLARACRDGPG